MDSHAKSSHAALNPEADAAKTVEQFREVANGHASMQDVWNKMAAESKSLGGGSKQDHAYFKAVDEGLKKSGLLPEISIKYAQWHKDDLSNDNGQIGPKDIRQWSFQRQTENGRVTEVEKDFINQLSTGYTDIYKKGRSLTHDYDAPHITADMLKAVDQKYVDDRHKADQMAEKKVEDRALAAELLQSFTADGNKLFNKVSRHNNCQFIDQESIESASNYDLNNRAMSHERGQKWHSYLDYKDHASINRLTNNMGRLSHGTGQVTLADIQNFAKQQGL